MGKYTKEQIAVATGVVNSMHKDDPTGFKSSNFPWGVVPISPWNMNLKILSTSSAVFRQDEINTIQRSIGKEKLCSMVSNPEYVVQSEKPEIIRLDGVDMIWNGHHRLATYWIYGEMEVECLLHQAEIDTAPKRKTIRY